LRIDSEGQCGGGGMRLVGLGDKVPELGEKLDRTS